MLKFLASVIVGRLYIPSSSGYNNIPSSHMGIKHILLVKFVPHRRNYILFTDSQLIGYLRDGLPGTRKINLDLHLEKNKYVSAHGYIVDSHA